MRITVLLLSMGTIILYGYALAGMGGYLLGHGRLDYILWGISAGTASAVTALWLWKKNLHLYFKDQENKD